MLLDLALSTPAFIIPLVLIGLCLVLYGREILEVLSFPIGALAGGILAYMILRGLLAPYEIPLLVEVLISFFLVLFGGMLGPGTMVIVLAVVVAITSVDVFNVFLGEGYEAVSWILGSFLFAVLIYPIQKFLHISSALVGGILIASSLFMFMESQDPVTRTVIQLVIIFVLAAAGGLFQSWLYRKLRAAQEEIVWVPTPSSS
ncbi:MAG TPA: hypothetical protein ENK47_00165 [Euryarchaeota archaeon]|nr:MAG: hypothetical protein B6U90_05995 [Thermoplasmatales archaeon ex4484_6]HHD15102.1 hypothetical protein [Euryarchaeota archaeon]